MTGHDGGRSILPEWEVEECVQINLARHAIRGDVADVIQRMFNCSLGLMKTISRTLGAYIVHTGGGTLRGGARQPGQTISVCLGQHKTAQDNSGQARGGHPSERSERARRGRGAQPPEKI